MSAAVPPTHAPDAHMSATRKAWWSLTLVPVGFILAFVAGEGIPALMGYDVAATTPPWWVMAIALAVSVVALAAPLPLTWHYTRQALALGEHGAKEPITVGAVFVGIFILVNLFSGVMRLLFE